MTVQQLCDEAGWNISDLMREAKISYPTAQKAVYRQGDLTRPMQVAICNALSKALNRRIAIDQVDW